MANLICPKCGTNYDSDKLRVYKCKDCKAWLDWDATEVVQKFEPDQVEVDSMENLDEATKALVLVANRTTYAVRSLSLYLFISITTSFLGLLVIYTAPEAAILGSITILIGFITAISVGISELNKSKP